MVRDEMKKINNKKTRKKLKSNGLTRKLNL